VKKSKLLIIFLIISLLFGAYNFICVKSQKQTANTLFITSLQMAKSCFETDYNTLNNADNSITDITAASNLHTAMSILSLTSYNIENQNQLFGALNELYWCITETNITESINANSRLKAFTEKSEIIIKYLTAISNNPNDTDSCEALSRLSSNLRFNIKDVLVNYIGISPNWAIAYKIDGDENKHDTYYTFKYIGKDADLIKYVNYSIDSSNEGEDGKFTLNSTKVYAGKLKLTAGPPKLTDRDITFKIKWNEKNETIILKKSE